MKELANRGDRVYLTNFFVTVHGKVPEVLDNPRFRQQRGTDRVSKRRLEDERAEAFAVRQLQGSVALVEPMNGQLQSPARVKATGARVRSCQRLRFRR